MNQLILFNSKPIINKNKKKKTFTNLLKPHIFPNLILVMRDLLIMPNNFDIQLSARIVQQMPAGVTTATTTMDVMQIMWHSDNIGLQTTRKLVNKSTEPLNSHSVDDLIVN